MHKDSIKDLKFNIYIILKHTHTHTHTQVQVKQIENILIAHNIAFNSLFFNVQKYAYQ